MTVLEDLWYGNIRPVENFVEGNMEYRKSLCLVSKSVPKGFTPRFFLPTVLRAKRWVSFFLRAKLVEGLCLR